jgi:pimeloyl-ACP methyl ester carboxylesterase
MLFSTACVQTDPARFALVEDFAYPTKYINQLPSFGQMQMAMVDLPPLGPSNDRVALCLHGQPTWSYLYRKMVTPLRIAGYRVVAPDLFGFGRSDKPVAADWYQFLTHRQSLIELIESLDLQRITLVVQDWGGLLGLTLPHQMPERFSQLLVMNTMLATGDLPLTRGFLDWRAYIAKQSGYIDCAKIIGRGTGHLSAIELGAYNAPFENTEQQAGVRRFPALVPEFPDSPGAEVSRVARQFWRDQWEGVSFMTVGAQDPVLGLGVMQNLAKTIRHCPVPFVIESAGHFVQEWQSDANPIVQRALETYAATT